MFSLLVRRSDTESADHGSTDKTSVTKLTSDDGKKKKFNFLELIKRNKEPTVIAETPKVIFYLFFFLIIIFKCE